MAQFDARARVLEEWFRLPQSRRCHATDAVAFAFRLLRDQCGIHINDLSSFKINLLRRFVQKPLAWRAFPPWVRIREKRADIAQPHRSQDRIADSVHQHIGVRVSVQPLFERDFHAAQDELSSQHKLVHIISDPNVRHT